MKRFFRYCCFFLSLSLPLGLSAQSRVLGRPKVYDAPEYGRRYAPAELKDYSKDIPWLVVADRAGALAYQRPNEGGASVPLTFLDYFYVVDTDGDWLKLVKCTPNGLKIAAMEREIGWVRRENVLEWTSGLRNQLTHIHQKTFLLNKAEFIGDVLKLPDETEVDVYADPNGRSKLKPRQIYNFYFVLKKENGYYLLCQDDQFSVFDLKSKIVGWVHQNRCSDWNTRIVLEPNFKDEAFAERKSAPAARVRAYGDFQVASEHGKTGAPQNKQVIWQNDPVLLSPDKRVGNRYMGQVMRFPMLSNGGGTNEAQSAAARLAVFNSAVISDITVKRNAQGVLEVISPETANAPIVDKVQQIKEQSLRGNVFFVIEGSASMNAVQKDIKSAMEQARKTAKFAHIRFGALIYRHPAEEKAPMGNGRTANKMIEVLPLTNDEESVFKFVEGAEFNRWKNTSPYTCLYYGLQEATKKAGFKSGETNIIFVLGNNADYRNDQDQAALYKKTKTDVDKIILAENLADLDIHLYGMQLQNRGDNASIGFAEQLRSIIERAAKVKFNRDRGDQTALKIQNDLLKAQNREVQAPKIKDLESGSDIFLEYAQVPGGFYRPDMNAGFAMPSIASRLRDNVSESFNRVNEFNEILYNVYIGGQSFEGATGEYDKVACGNFTAMYAQFLRDDLVKQSGVSANDAIESTGKKYSLHAEAYFPRSVPGTKHPMFSFVLFMPEADVREYQKRINAIVRNPPPTTDEKRKALIECYLALLKQFTGKDFSDGAARKEFDKMERRQIVEYMQGVKGEGLDIDIPLDVNMACILDKDCTTEAQIFDLFGRFAKVVEYLDGVLRQGSSEGEHLAFKTTPDEDGGGGVYYWIPIEKTF